MAADATYILSTPFITEKESFLSSDHLPDSQGIKSSLEPFLYFAYY
jgi:hypothetical protein